MTSLFRSKRLVAIVFVVALLTLWNPLAFSQSQSFLVASLLITLASWATDALHKSLASLFLLLSFALFGQTPILDIVSFVWSDTNLLIMTTTLLSIGLLNTGWVERGIVKLLGPFTRNLWTFLLFPYLLGIGLVFIIPQGFARVVVIGTIFSKLLSAETGDFKERRSVFLFNAFLGVTMGYMFFSNGDIVLNYSALQLAGPEASRGLNFGSWFQLMSLPTLVTILVSLFLVRGLFAKELSGDFDGRQFLAPNSHQEQEELLPAWQLLALLATLIFAWQTLAFHGIPAWIWTLVAIAFLAWKKALTWSDLKHINPHFILLLMTVFSIGKVLSQAGVTGIVFEALSSFLPDSQSPFFLVLIFLMVMGLHMCIGSAVATMSVVLPFLIPLLDAAGYPGEISLLITYSLVNIHFLLPFHHATMMIGVGKGYYTDKFMVRFGLAMTLLAPVLILSVYLNWWRFLGWL